MRSIGLAVRGHRVTNGLFSPPRGPSADRGNKTVRARAPSKVMLLACLSDRPECVCSARALEQAVGSSYSCENAFSQRVQLNLSGSRWIRQILYLSTTFRTSRALRQIALPRPPPNFKSKNDDKAD